MGPSTWCRCIADDGAICKPLLIATRPVIVVGATLIVRESILGAIDLGGLVINHSPFQRCPISQDAKFEMRNARRKKCRSPESVTHLATNLGEPAQERP